MHGAVLGRIFANIEQMSLKEIQELENKISDRKNKLSDQNQLVKKSEFEKIKPELKKRIDKIVKELKDIKGSVEFDIPVKLKIKCSNVDKGYILEYINNECPEDMWLNTEFEFKFNKNALSKEFKDIMDLIEEDFSGYCSEMINYDEESLKFYKKIVKCFPEINEKFNKIQKEIVDITDVVSKYDFYDFLGEFYEKY